MTRILVDTSIWIDHLHRAEPSLQGFLGESRVIAHPMIIGELALGSIRNRSEVLSLLSGLPAAPVATPSEVLRLVEDRHLHGTGISLVDAHLLASALIGGDVRLWTRDRRLSAAASDAGVLADV